MLIVCVRGFQERREEKPCRRGGPARAGRRINIAPALQGMFFYGRERRVWMPDVRGLFYTWRARERGNVQT